MSVYNVDSIHCSRSNWNIAYFLLFVSISARLAGLRAVRKKTTPL